MNIFILFQFKKYSQVVARCEEVILLNAKTCLQQSELYPTQLLHKQVVQLYLEQNDYLSGKVTCLQQSELYPTQLLHKQVVQLYLEQNDYLSGNIHEPRHVICNAKTKTQISFAVTANRISTFVFATRILQSLFYLNPKSQDSSHLLWLYSLVRV